MPSLFEARSYSLQLRHGPLLEDRYQIAWLASIECKEPTMATKMGGRVHGFEVGRGGTLVFLDNDPASGPKGNFFVIPNDHVNYNALYSLALAAAINRWEIVIRIAGDGQIDPNVEAHVKSIGVDF